MSLVVATYLAEGIILASDSRQTLNVEKKEKDGKLLDKLSLVNSDSVSKTFELVKQRIGINTFGQDLINGIPTGSYIKQFEETLLKTDNIETVPIKLLNFFRTIDSHVDTGFHIAGYSKEAKKELEKATKKEISTPHIYTISVKNNTVERVNYNEEQKKVLYGSTWGGETDIISGLLKIGIKDAPQIAWDAMALQDGIDFSVFTISTTANIMRFQIRPKTVGGAIDILLITPREIRWIRKKEFHGGE